MADVTTLAESAQAIFCSLADILGSAESNKRLDLKRFKTFQEFQAFSQNKKDLQKAIDGVDVDANVKEIFEFLDNTIKAPLLVDHFVKGPHHVWTDVESRNIVRLWQPYNGLEIFDPAYLF